MMFLFNDTLLDIPQASDLLREGKFPIPEADFARMSLGSIAMLAREEVYKDLDLPKNQPEVAKHLAILLAAKSGANAVLVGPPLGGARKPEQMGLRLAEVSLVTISNLYQMQEGGSLTPAHVNRAVWLTLQEA